MSDPDALGTQFTDDAFAALMEAAPDAVVVVDRKGRICLVNRETEALFGYPRAELVGTPLEILIPNHAATDDVALHSGYAESVERPVRACVEMAGSRRDGTAFPLDVSLGSADTRIGEMAVLIIRDATHRKRSEAAMAHQALHDALTGLPNRLLLEDRLSQALGRSRRAGTRVAVLFLDVDRLKVINDSRGHSAGDRLLTAISDRLRHIVRQGETVARFGGDEFVIVSEGVRDALQAEALGARVTEAFNEPMLVEGVPLKVGVSVGVALEDQGASPESLLRDADAAMYRAKEQGRERVVIFDAGLRADAMERLANETAMRSALENSDFVVMFQPIVDLTGGRVVGVEALARWEHPVKGLLDPSSFIPLAEETGLIVPLGAAILRAACTHVAGWKRAHPELAELSLSVNLSARQLMTLELREAIKEILDETGLRPQDLCLEITESILLEDADSSAWALGELKALGIRIAVDDFGTGYSSLTYLKRFPVDALKIDRSFVAGLGGPGGHQGDRAIIAGIIDVAHAFGMTTVAEGVENAAQKAQLKALGCEHAQGYLWRPPMFAATAVSWILQSDTLRDSDDYAGDSPLPTVLLVDDDKPHRGLLKFLFEEHGFAVVGEAGDGREAIALARHFQPDVIMLDLAMPGVGGLEALPLILAVAPRSRVVVTSALDAGDVEGRAMEAGAAGYFVKGNDIEVLLEYVDELLAAPVAR